MQDTVLILGARGRFGLAAALAFADAGWRVLAQMRPGAQVPAAVQGDLRIQWLDTDVQQPEALVQAALARAPDVAVVVHGLSPLYTNAAWKQQALPMLDAALALCRRLGATLMLPGNVYNFGAGMPALLREDTPQQAATIKGQIRIAMEAQLQRSGVRSVVIRAGDFFGSGRGSWLDQAMVKDLPKGVLTYPGPLDVATAWAYLPDLGRCFVQVAQRRAQLPAFALLHFAGHSISARQWLALLTPLARAQGWLAPDASLRYQRLPWTLIRWASLLRPVWASLVEMRYLWDTPHALDNSRLTALLGAEPHTPLDQAAHASLTDLGLLPPPALAAAQPGRA